MALKVFACLALAAAGAGCTVYEAYTVKETRSRPERPVEVARQGDVSSFDKALSAGADIATAIIAPVAAVAKAIVVSVVDVEVNRSKETRTIKGSRWFTTDRSRFPEASARSEKEFGQAAVEVEKKEEAK